jgi:hypothetical protein
MNNMIETSGHPLTMSSREIAELVSARHDNVKRTIERLAEAGTIARPPLEDVQETGGNNRTYITQEYRIGKRDSYVIVAQLSPEFTARLVDRWQELEKQAQDFDPAAILESPPSSRARSVLDVIAAPPVRPDPKTDDPLLPVLRAALDYEKFGDPEVDWEEQRLRRQFLEFWYGPAPSRESALLALEFVTRETEEFPGSPASKSMQAAADRYFRWCCGNG